MYVMEPSPGAGPMLLGSQSSHDKLQVSKTSHVQILREYFYMLFHTSLNVSKVIWKQKRNELVEHSVITQSLLCEAQRGKQFFFRKLGLSLKMDLS